MKGQVAEARALQAAHLPNPRVRRVSRQRFESCSTLLSISGKKRCWYCSEHGSCTSSTTSARARPYADRTPLYLPRKRNSRREMRRSKICQRSRNPPPLLVYEDGLHAQGSGNRAGVLAARTPETCQHVLRGVVALGLESERTKKKRRKHQRLKQIFSCAISPHLNED